MCARACACVFACVYARALARACLSHRLTICGSDLLATQVFVVRKERASSSDPFQSKVSITFTRRPAGDPRLGESMLHAGSSHRVVTAVCRTLLEK